MSGSPDNASSSCTSPSAPGRSVAHSGAATLDACDDPAARVLPFLAQLRAALQDFSVGGEPKSFDLRGLPFSTEEEQLIERLLGRGEVTAQLNALGGSEVWETSLASVWFVVHRNEAGDTLCKLIEVCDFPSLLCAQPEDVRDAVQEFDRRIALAAGELAALQPAKGAPDR